MITHTSTQASVLIWQFVCRENFGSLLEGQCWCKTLHSLHTTPLQVFYRIICSQHAPWNGYLATFCCCKTSMCHTTHARSTGTFLWQTTQANRCVCKIHSRSHKQPKDGKVTLNTETLSSSTIKWLTELRLKVCSMYGPRACVLSSALLRTPVAPK